MEILGTNCFYPLGEMYGQDMSNEFCWPQSKYAHTRWKDSIDREAFTQFYALTAIDDTIVDLTAILSFTTS